MGHQGKQAVSLGSAAIPSTSSDRATSSFSARLCQLGRSPPIPLCPSRVFGSQNLTTVKLKGVGESFKKYPDYESKGIKAHFNLDESGVLSLDRVSTEWGSPCARQSMASPFPLGLHVELNMTKRCRLGGLWSSPGLPRDLVWTFL